MSESAQMAESTRGALGVPAPRGQARSYTEALTTRAQSPSTQHHEGQSSAHCRPEIGGMNR